ncbi:hypothetical protein EYR41_000027 [Orbilia oligospora]|uniref:Uncharacterized protein n=1 Tax=Orbilia oligospora TaxID=2813651 RepID=A0A7C8PCU2_ORBOL|nr:hypothetical protein TWF751_006507 [Orbilia oligospora]KAF3235186.1 hypothetical protein TWF128_001937 [Orbilia oligospora]KAF3253619.1 hypothetical protein TWF217_007404 [Orbilia oligospora]TGJ72900.1 hypothetical protein EYR41_000027 [Orbilia oligospora]
MFGSAALPSIGWGGIVVLTCFIAQGRNYVLSTPTWNRYIQTEWTNLESIAKQIDVLKYTINQDCPVGGGAPAFLPVSESLYRRSLLALIDVLGEARLAFPLRPGVARIPPADALREMLDSGWDELWPTNRVKEMLDEIHLVGANSVLVAIRISNNINDMPGWEHADSLTDQENIDSLARRIDSDGDFNAGGVEGVIIQPDLQQSRVVLKTRLRSLIQFLEFSRMQFRIFASKASIEMANPILIDLIRDHDPNHGEEEAPFTFVDLLGNIAKWYECWIPEFQDFLYLVEHELGPLPGPDWWDEEEPVTGLIEEIGDPNLGLAMELEDGN